MRDNWISNSVKGLVVWWPSGGEWGKRQIQAFSWRPSSSSSLGPAGKLEGPGPPWATHFFVWICNKPFSIPNSNVLVLMGLTVHQPHRLATFPHSLPYDYHATDPWLNFTHCHSLTVGCLWAGPTTALSNGSTGPQTVTHWQLVARGWGPLWCPPVAEQY